MRLMLLGVGAMNSPRYLPAGLLVGWRGRRVMLDGGGLAAPRAPVSGWLVTDARAELMPSIRRLARALGVEPDVGAWEAAGLRIRPLPVTHTSHATYGYLIDAGARRIAWAPEFLDFPPWAADADLMFADAAGWQRPIRFAGGVGGHASVLDTARHAQRYGVKRLVFAHIGRPSIRARDAGLQPPYGEWGVEGHLYRITIHPMRVGGPALVGHLPVDVSPTPSGGGGWPADV
jgi:hypothetical protein